MDEPSRKVQARIRWTEEKAKNTPWVTWKDDKPFVGERRVVYQDQKADVLKEEYKQVPPSIGYLRYYDIIDRKYVGITRRFLQHWLADQEAKQLYRRPNRVRNTRVSVGKKPLHSWQADFGNFGQKGHYQYQGVNYTAFAVFVDKFTKLAFVFPVRTESTQEGIRIVGLWLKAVEKAHKGGREMVRVLQTDHGPAWSTEFTEHLKTLDITHVKGRPFRAASQGQVERMVQTVKGYLRSFAEQKYPDRQKLAWPRVVPEVINVLNNTWQRILKMSPVEALQASTEEIQERLKAEGDKRTVTHIYEQKPLQPGDKVRLSLRAIGDSQTKSQIKQGTYKASNQQWSKEGPYTVERRYGRSTYYLVEVTGRWDRSDLLHVPTGEPQPYEA